MSADSAARKQRQIACVCDDFRAIWQPLFLAHNPLCHSTPLTRSNYGQETGDYPTCCICTHGAVESCLHTSRLGLDNQRLKVVWVLHKCTQMDSTSSEPCLMQQQDADASGSSSSSSSKSVAAAEPPELKIAWQYRKYIAEGKQRQDEGGGSSQGSTAGKARPAQK